MILWKRHNKRAGDWAHLDSPKDHPRYAAIAEMLAHHGTGDNVLDVGCGTALLRRWLPTDTRYTGIDLSAEAIQVARQRDAALRISATSAESFDAGDERFDTIVFSEMLYYLRNPVALLRQYVSLLRPGGYFLCSIFQKPDRLTPAHRLWHWLGGGRRPYSNVHCAQMVRAFMTKAAWPILEERFVPQPGTTCGWRVWLVQPQPCLQAIPKRRESRTGLFSSLALENNARSHPPLSLRKELSPP